MESGGRWLKKIGVGNVIKLNTFFPGEYLGPKKTPTQRVSAVRRELNEIPLRKEFLQL